MEIASKMCRLCLSESNFNVSLYGSFCQRNHIVKKINICLNIVVEENDFLTTICYKCTENIERYHSFILLIQNSQHKLNEPRQKKETINSHVTSYVRKQVYDDADYTFSFLDMPKNTVKDDHKSSSPMFSYFSPSNTAVKRSADRSWKAPQIIETRQSLKRGKLSVKSEQPRHLSRDLFESQSQEVEEPRNLETAVSPENNIINKIRHMCFKKTNF